MELLVVVPVAVVVALVTLLVCDLAGSIARAKGSSYWGFFAFGLLGWFPALLAALAMRDRGDVLAGPDARRAETVLATTVVVLAVLAAAAGLAAALLYAP